MHGALCLGEGVGGYERCQFWAIVGFGEEGDRALLCVVCVHSCWASELYLLDGIIGSAYAYVGCGGVRCIVDGFVGK